MEAQNKENNFTYEVEKETDGEDILGELIIYIAGKCDDDSTFGATKLNKILWWSDFVAFAEYGKPITGVAYQRLQNGPAPKRLLPVRDKLIHDGSIVIRPHKESLGYARNIVTPLREPKMDCFSAHEIALVDRIIEMTRGKTASEISDMSHGKAWEIAGGNKEPIPYEAVFLSNEPVNAYDISRTRELAREHGWC